MTITNKTITITLDDKEVEAIVSALDTAVDLFNLRYEDAKDEQKKSTISAALTEARRLRNEFGAIIGVHYTR